MIRIGKILPGWISGQTGYLAQTEFTESIELSTDNKTKMKILTQAQSSTNQKDKET